ncbi:MAG: serine protease Do [Chloroflexota bacterium]|jgi:serine protease Do|nr:serine protease Do [Chloroflexota bacterium]
MSAIEEFQAAIQGVATKIGPSVVGIGRHLRGSGVVIGDGRVLTNAHNVRGEQVTVTFADGRSTAGRLAGIDVDGDLAVIEVDTAGAKPLAWGAGDSLATGAAVFGAAASPGGGTRVTFGTVSAVARAFRGPGGRQIGGSVEHTAPLAPGSSGGPIVDAKGQFLGLNTNRLGEGFYLAVPADDALRQRVDALGRGERVERPRLGVSIAPAHVARRLQRSVGLPERDGLLVRDVEDDSPAARAGIAQGDLIVSLAGKAISDADELLEAIAAAGDSYEVKIVRGTEERTVIVGGAAASGEA